MEYDKFAVEALRLGMTSVLPEIFSKIIDDALYTPADISQLLCISDETVRRWFRKGDLPAETSGRYSTTGLGLKRYLFSRPAIQARVKRTGIL